MEALTVGSSADALGDRFVFVCVCVCVCVLEYSNRQLKCFISTSSNIPHYDST
jgi:hypothetical protein